MSREITLAPIDKFPGERTKYPKTDAFKATYAQTLDLLDRELWHVQAVGSTVVVQLDVDRAEILKDGQRLRHNARPRSAAVVLSFTSSKMGKLRFGCDRFAHWQANLRAIALGMESLRRVDRYGITSDGQQYAGFRAIEAAESARGFETTDAAARYIVSQSKPDAHEAWIDGVAGMILDDPDLLDHYFRRAMKVHHPDVGGDEKTSALLNTARAMIEEARQ